MSIFKHSIASFRRRAKKMDRDLAEYVNQLGTEAKILTAGIDEAAKKRDQVNRIKAQAEAIREATQKLL